MYIFYMRFGLIIMVKMLHSPFEATLLYILIENDFLYT